MTDQAAIKGTYSDLKFIKTRKVAQVVIEVPIEQAGAFVRAFGTPQPDQETWVAIARLGEAVKEEKPKQRSLAKEAGILCGEDLFHTYLRTAHSDIWSWLVTDEDDAMTASAKVVRELCGVRSRSDLDTSGAGAHHWRHLRGNYEAWKRCIEPAA